MKKIKINLFLVSILSAFPMIAAAAQPEEVVYEDDTSGGQYSDYEYVYEDTNTQPAADAASNVQWEEVPANDVQIVYDNRPYTQAEAKPVYDDQPADAYAQPSFQPETVVYESARPAQPARPAQAAAPTLPAAELGERLLTAARDGKLGDVRWLLRKGADPEYQTHANAWSPLDLVVKGGWVDVAKVFQEEGVSFKKKGALGVTFLHQAAAAGKLPMVQFLVSAGISPNSITSKGWTPLHHAARFGHAQVVDYLLRAGASADERNSDGFRPRELAANARHTEVLQLL